MRPPVLPSFVRKPMRRGGAHDCDIIRCHMTPDPKELVPVLRGVSHAYAFWAALAAAVMLIVLAPTALARVAAVVYGIGLCGLFGASATYHRWRWNPHWRPILRRIDH